MKISHGIFLAIGGLLVACSLVCALNVKDKLLEQWYIFELKSKNGETLRSAVVELGDRASVQAIPDIIRMYDRTCNDRNFHEPERFYEAIIYSIARMGPKAISPLTKLLKDKRDFVRQLAVSSLCEMHGLTEAAIPALIDALADQNMGVRSVSAGALAKMGPLSKAAIPILVRMLTDPHALVRHSAATALGTIGTESEDATQALSEALKDSDEYVSKAAAEALEKIRRSR
jgi:HEAT repeat protein